MNSGFSSSRMRVLAVAGGTALMAMSYVAHSLPTALVMPVAPVLGHADDAGLGGGVGSGIGIAFLAGDGGDVDDAAVVASLHAREHRAVDVEGAVEIDVDDAAPFVELVFLERSVLAGNAGGMDEDVELAQILLDLGDGSGHRIVVRDVDGHRRGGRAEIGL